MENTGWEFLLEGKRCLPPLVFWVFWVCFLGGCTKELSKTPNVSIKESHHSYVLYSGGHRYEGVSIPDVIQNRNRAFRVISTADLSPEFDIIAADSTPDLLKTLSETFCLSIKREIRTIPVYVITKRENLSLDFKVSVAKDQKSTYKVFPVRTCKHFYHLDTYFDLFKPYEPTRYQFNNFTLKALTFWLEKYRNEVFIDETHLTGAYDFELVSDTKNNITLVSSLSGLGFKIIQSERSVEAIYIDPIPECLSSVEFPKPDTRYILYPAWENIK